MDELAVIQFESSTACQATCTMCPRPGMKRPKGHMTEALFKKIVDDGMAMGVKRYIPFLLGEPLLFPPLLDWIEYMCERDLLVTLFTTASHLTKEKADRLAKLPMESVTISFHGGTKPVYEKVMGLDFDNAVANSDYFLGLDKPYRASIFMSVFEDTAGTEDQFLRLWARKGGGLGPWFNWAGGKASEMNKVHLKPPIPCGRLLSNMTIMWNGLVCLCCMDSEGEVILGDVNTESIADIWAHNQPMRDRHHALDFDMALCRTCNMNRLY